MKQTTAKAFGSWVSPVSGASLVEDSLRLGQIQVSEDHIFWTEGRPSEKGRTALMSASPGKGNPSEVSPGLDVRTRAHEYGGGAFLSSHGRIFVVSNEDQQIYEITEDGKHISITKQPNSRFADMVLDDKRQRLIAVMESHENKDEVVNALVSIPLSGDTELEVIVEGNDFYSNPQLSPDQSKLVYITWNHPNMPWDGTELHLTELNDHGAVAQSACIAGGDEISIFQPEWNPDGSLYYVSDRSGWWNLYAFQNGAHRCLWEKEAEFGLPNWVFGMRCYCVPSAGQIMGTYKQEGLYHLFQLNVAEGTVEEIETLYSEIDQVRGVGNTVGFLGSSHTKPGEVVAIDLTTGVTKTLQVSSPATLSPEFVSQAEQISFEGRPGELCYAWYYPPKNPKYSQLDGELPPLIVLSHGGPTAFSSASFSKAIQFWTTRGFAIADVNYSGSTGFGRAYRKRLNGTWGIRDVEDCCGAALALVDKGLADPERLIIKGGSAGGYTTLAALTFQDVFKAGASYYGVGDLEALARDTHKFESRYMDRLVGRYPEDKEIYQARSPIRHAQALDCPVIFFQGLDDPVVPPNQAEAMVDVLKTKGVPVAYIPYAGESHGFRQASTIINAIESELSFYCQIFGIPHPEDILEIEISNLHA